MRCCGRRGDSAGLSVSGSGVLAIWQAQNNPTALSSTASLPICADLYGPRVVQTIVDLWGLETRLNDRERVCCVFVVVVRPAARISAHVIFSDMCSTTSHRYYDIPCADPSSCILASASPAPLPPPSFRQTCAARLPLR
jgi:hypothetical protein